MGEKSNCKRKSPWAWDWIELKRFRMQVMWCKILISLNVLVFFHFPLFDSFFPGVKMWGKSKLRPAPEYSDPIYFVIYNERPQSESFHASIMDTVMGWSCFCMLVKPPNHTRRHTTAQTHNSHTRSGISKHTSPLCMCVIKFLTAQWNALQHLKMKQLLR